MAEDNEVFNVPTEIMEKVTMIVMDAVPEKQALKVVLMMVEGFKNAKSDTERLGALLGHVYGLLGFGYYLGSQDTFTALLSQAEAWDKAGRPDDFLDKMMKNSGSSFSEN